LIAVHAKEAMSGWEGNGENEWKGKRGKRGIRSHQALSPLKVIAKLEWKWSLER
jgi:hypothetical protein